MFLFLKFLPSYRTSKSHGFSVTLTTLTSISRSYGYWSLSHGKVKSILCPKNCLVFKKQQWLTWLPHKLEKKISLVSPTNGSQDSLIRALKQVFFNFGHFNLPSASISRFLAKSPGFLGNFFGHPRFWKWQDWKVWSYEISNRVVNKNKDLWLFRLFMILQKCIS